MIYFKKQRHDSTQRNVMTGNPHVLIIIPPETFRRPIPQLGVLYLAGALKRKGIPCRLLDCKVADIDFDGIHRYKIVERSLLHPIQWNVIREKIIDYHPDIIGITALTPQIKNGAKIAQMVKEEFKDVPVLVGGVHASALPRETLEEFPSFDVLFRGEAEQTLCDFVELWRDESSEWKNLPGIFYRENGDIKESAGFPRLEDMDSLPFPARDMAPMSEYQSYLNASKYLGDAYAAGSMMTSRGCPSRCTFCTSPGIRGRQFRAQSPARVLDEMSYVMKHYGVKVFLFWDDIFTVDRQRVHEICDHIISQNWNIAFTCFSKVGQIDVPLMEKMKRAGCTYINYGIETGSDSVMRSIKKGITLESTVRVIRQTVEAGIKPSAGFILGHPADTHETIQETIRYTTQLARTGLEHIGFWIATPYPGTEMFEKERGKIRSFDWDAYTHIGLNANENPPVYLPEGLTAAHLLRYQKKAYRAFNRTLLLKKLLRGNVKPFMKALFQKTRGILKRGAQRMIKLPDAGATFPQA